MNSNVPMINFFMKRTEYDENINIIGCISTSIKNSISVEQLENIAFQIERKFLLTGAKNVNTIYFIYSENVEKDKVFNTGNIKFWLIDIIAGQLIIYENQPDDFDGLKLQIQMSLNEISSHSDYRTGRTVSSFGSNRNRQSNLKTIPYVTILIILINTIIFFVLEHMGSTENAVFMMKHGAANSKLIFDESEYYRLFTSMFLHFGLAHLLNNMISLWFVGGEVERLYGRIEYVIIYVMTGLAGSIVSAMYNYVNGRDRVSAGASGAIYGILGALVVLFLRYRGKRNSRAYKMLMLLAFLIMAGRATGNVDNMAHLGGFIAGVICGFLFSMLNEKQDEMN